MWMLPLYLHINKNSSDDDDDDAMGFRRYVSDVAAHWFCPSVLPVHGRIRNLQTKKTSCNKC